MTLAQILLWLLIWIVIWALAQSYDRSYQLKELKLKKAVYKWALDWERELTKRQTKRIWELQRELSDLRNQMVEINKKDSPRVTTEMMKQAIIELRQQWMTCKQIWFTLWFDKSAIAKALKRWDIK
jgi:hypothetical protein